MGKKKTSSPDKGDSALAFIKVCGLVMTKVGIIGFVVIVITFYIFWFVPQNLKDELTNTWLLFKCETCQNIYSILIIVLVITFMFQNWFFRQSIKLKDNRIKEISKEKTELQEKLLNKNLKSTNT